MPVTVPNFLNNYQTPLGQAFKGLITTLASKPSAAQQQRDADTADLAHWKSLGLQGLGDQLAKGFPVDAPPAVGTGAPAVSPIQPSSPAFVPTANGQQNPLAARIAQLAPSAVPANAPVAPTGPAPAVSVPQEPGTEGAPSPILAAFAPPPAAAPAAPQKPSIDMGQYTRNALFAGLKPEEAGGYMLLGDANTYGARDPRTTNATVGAGKSYDSTAEHFDISQANDLTKAQNTNLMSRENNADTQATSRANNAANIKKDFGIESMKEKHADGQTQAEAGNWTPAAIDYAAEIYRRTGQLPSVGMGKQAGAVRGNIVNRAAEFDHQDGKSPGDTVAGFAEYKGGVAGEQTLGRRAANADMAVNELTNLIPQAKAAYANVARTGFVPADTLLRAYQEGTNDPDLSKAAVSVNDVVNAHARAINPNGEVTDAGRAQGYKLLGTAKDQNAFNATLDQMMLGAQAARKSPHQSRTQLHEDIVGSGGTGGRSGTPPPAAAPAAEEWVRGPDGKLQRKQ